MLFTFILSFLLSLAGDSKGLKFDAELTKFLANTGYIPLAHLTNRSCKPPGKDKKVKMNARA